MSWGPSLLADALAEALSGHRCISAWLGYDNVLFLGLGDTPGPTRTPDGQRTKPPYELQTNFADWTVQVLGSSVGADDDAARLELATLALVGQAVAGWRLEDGHALRVEFDGGCWLRVMPMTDADLAGKGAWWLDMPGGRVVAVSCDGQVAAADSKRPIHEWFSRPGG